MSLTAERDPVTVAELVAAITEQRRADAAQPVRQPVEHDEAGPVLASSVVVLGAHPGAGASAVALALADAAARREPGDGHAPVRLVDAAPQRSSGLVCAAERELGADPSGWRIGWRGGVEIHRPLATVASPVELTGLAAFASGWLVVDAGWSLDELRATPNPVTAALAGGVLVLVCRATIPGVRRAERVLADLPGHPMVVGVGARRWPGQVRATFGPLLTQAFEAGRCLLIPADRRLEVNGIDAQPLPKAFVAAASRLLDLVWPEPRVAPAPRTKG